jgi:vacuolar-type H+-ATPase subunit F/Vma7
METDTTNRQELERRLAQARRIAALLIDEAIRERLRRRIKELEEELKGD